MKTSSVLASLLFGSFAVAAPLQARGRPAVTHTRVVTETVVVYTTVYDDVPEATATSEGLFYEQPKVTSSSVVASSSAAVSSAQAPSSVYTPPAPATSAAAASTPVVEQPKQETQPTSAAAAPVVASSAAAPAPAATSAAAVQPQAQTKPAASSDTTTGTYSGDITVYEPAGGYGACGTQLQNTDMVVALSHVAFGASTYDTMTGAATNAWCGQKINIYYNGNTVQATIMDMCPGCSGDDIDLSDAVWKAVTGSDEKTRYQATWSKAS